MKFIKPTPVAGDVFVSSTVPETDHAAWSGATTYELGGMCISTATHRIYESVQAGNLNHDPTTDTLSEWWLDIGPTNRWAMFDATVGTVTTATPGTGDAVIEVVLQPGIVGSLALLDIQAATVRVQVVDGAETVFDHVYTMADAADVFDGYSYFFEPIARQTTLIVEDLPPYSAGVLTVTLTEPTTAECGTLVVGNAVRLGDTHYGASVSIVDYSRKAADDFGVVSVVERAYSKRIESECLVENARMDYITRVLAQVRATPCVWVFDNGIGYDSLIAYGYYRDWRIGIRYPLHSLCNMTIEGLT